jgi:hypothetical protein
MQLMKTFMCRLVGDREPRQYEVTLKMRSVEKLSLGVEERRHQRLVLNGRYDHAYDEHFRHSAKLAPSRNTWLHNLMFKQMQDNPCYNRGTE